MARTPSPGPGSSPRSSPPPRRRRSRTRSRSPISPTPSRTPSRSRSRSGSRSRTPSRSRSRSRSQPGTDSGKAATWDDKIEYDEFVAADEETPTFKLEEATLNLVTSKVYKAAPLAKKYYEDLKKSRYMLPRDVHETLEPKPVPAQVVSSVNGMNFHKLHGNLYTLHNISRVSQRPVWAVTELMQKVRGNLKKIAPISFVSPPFLTGPSTPLPDGHVQLNYPEEDRLRHMAKLPQNPTPQQIAEMHESLGVYKKFHEEASKAMVSMLSTFQSQQGSIGKMKESMDDMWLRTQDYFNMARYLN